MKHIILFLALSFNTAIFAQKALDSTVVRKLEFMHYLERQITAIERQPDFISYYKKIVADNPVPKIDIDHYLGIKVAPQSINDFTNRVSVKNSESLMKIMEEYGYPSFERLNAARVDKTEILGIGVFFTRADNGYKKQFRKMMKAEYKKGNVSAREYNFCKLLLQTNDHMLTEKDLEQAGTKMQKS